MGLIWPITVEDLLKRRTPDCFAYPVGCSPCGTFSPKPLLPTPAADSHLLSFAQAWDYPAMHRDDAVRTSDYGPSSRIYLWIVCRPRLAMSIFELIANQSSAKAVHRLGVIPVNKRDDVESSPRYRFALVEVPRVSAPGQTRLHYFPRRDYLGVWENPPDETSDPVPIQPKQVQSGLGVHFPCML